MEANRINIEKIKYTPMISRSANGIRKITDTEKESGRLDGNVINLSDLTTDKSENAFNCAASLFLTAGPRLSDVARVFDNSSAMRKQIAECLLTFDNLGPMRKQIIECSSPIRQFRSTVLSGLLSWDYSIVRKERDSGNERIYLRFPLSLICQYP